MTSRFSRAQGGKPVGREASCLGQVQLSYQVRSVLEAGGYKGQELTEPLLSADIDSEARRSG